MSDSFQRSDIPQGEAPSSGLVRGFDGTEDPAAGAAMSAEASLTVDGVDDAVLSELFDRIRIDVVVHDGPNDRVMHDVPVHFGHLHAVAAPAVTAETSGEPADIHAQDDIVSRRAVIAMSGKTPRAEDLFRTVAVTLDATPGNQVEGISPLYLVSDLDGPDALSAVVALSTRLAPDTLVGMLRSVEMSHEGAVSLRLVDMEHVVCDTEACTVPWPPARCRAAVLAPWFDMDPEARYGDEPISLLLAMAPDAERVGMVSDHWIIGETQ